MQLALRLPCHKPAKAAGTTPQCKPARQDEVLRRVVRCRTPALGGQLFACPDCVAHHHGYHSCNDRHCPLCGQSEADDWLERQ